MHARPSTNTNIISKEKTRMVAKKTAEAAKPVQRQKLDANEIVVSGDFEAVPGAFGNGLEDDHPLSKAIAYSLEHDTAVRFPTETPELVEKILRRELNKKGLGLRVQSEAQQVVFKVGKKKGGRVEDRIDHAPVEDASDTELSE
jgi:hypothetical protein